jgi:molecular chaperone GrpE
MVKEQHTPDIQEQAEMPAGEPRAGKEGVTPAAAGESPADQAAAGPDSPEQLTALLEDARSKADEHWNALLRARAEIENLNRRHAREMENAHKFALDGFVRELLQVRDSLELGHDAALDAKADVEKLREGTELTLKLLTDVMNKFGVQQISPMGEPFNPELHQAMTTQPRDDVPPNTVVAVVQKGSLLNGRLVRPALVMVSAAAG